MENMADIPHGVIDKTGTLTEGKLTVSNFTASSIWDAEIKCLCALICAAEEHGAASYPIGAAVFPSALQSAAERWEKYKGHGALRELEEISGKGVKCFVDHGD